MSGDDIDPNVDPENDPDPQDEYVPPTREEHARMVAALAARKAEAKEARREAAALKEAAAKGKTDPDADDKAARVQEASDTRARRSAGLTALVEAGMTKAQAKDALPLLKLDKLAVDQDGDVDDEDLTDAVKALRSKFPGMFPADGKRHPRARTADNPGGDDKTKTPTQRTNDRLLRAAGLA